MRELIRSEVEGQHTVILNVEYDVYYVVYGEHKSDPIYDKDDAVDEYISCLSHAMTCGSCLEETSLGRRHVGA